ncbi:unnamed protein product [Allacma fusca]|uniref:Dynein light chain n=1 Tax=Allacma fusca TaxID=39272 RepID=A0A8J2NXH3_9HEXA|nr:unnamed protein product [Allacma fusca]
MEHEDDKNKDHGGEDKKTAATYPLVRFAEVPEDTKPEIIDLITGAIEKYLTDIEAACKAIKEEMDKVYGPYWHVVVGESFGFEVTYQKEHFIYMFFGGNLGICLWKCC